MTVTKVNFFFTMAIKLIEHKTDYILGSKYFYDVEKITFESKILRLMGFVT
jgi:hypothetical protein